jgi:spermidine/putrescine transport system permease protein
MTTTTAPVSASRGASRRGAEGSGGDAGLRRASPPLLVLVGFVFFFMYLPMLLIVIFSFNSSQVTTLPLERFTLHWYQELLADRKVIDAFVNTLIVGAGTTIVALLIGGSGAFALNRLNFPGKAIYEYVVTMPFVLPEIVTGIALLTYYTWAGMRLSLLTVLIGHVVFCLSVAVRTIGARLQSLPRSYEEASYDLGAGRLRTFFLITLPNIRTALFTAGLLIFTISFDETVITIFAIGQQNTLPMVIWAMMRRGFTPEVNALATLTFVASLILIVIVGVRLREEV